MKKKIIQVVKYYDMQLNHLKSSNFQGRLVYFLDLHGKRSYICLFIFSNSKVWSTLFVVHNYTILRELTD